MEVIERPKEAEAPPASVTRDAVVDPQSGAVIMEIGEVLDADKSHRVNALLREVTPPPTAGEDEGPDVMTESRWNDAVSEWTFPLTEHLLDKFITEQTPVTVSWPGGHLAGELSYDDTDDSYLVKSDRSHTSFDIAEIAKIEVNLAEGATITLE